MDSVFHLKKQNLSAPAGKNFLKAEEYGQLLKANEILDAAHITASETIAQAHEIYEINKKKGYEDGLTEGRLEHAQKIMDTAIEAIEFFGTMENTIAKLVIECLEKVIEAIDKEELVLEIVKSGLAIARNEKRVVVRVCEDDLDAVQNSLSSLLQTYPGISFLDIAADSRLKRGACLIESELGVVDSSLETQLEAIKRAILKRI